MLLDRVRQALAPDYTVEAELGHGGMGIVYLGRDVTLDRPVAIKIIRPEFATARAVSRFLREARILASLRHPHIVTIFRAGENDGIAYYVMELVTGPTLRERLAQGPLPPAAATGIALDLLDALAAVHAQGVVHRDIKPANIFLREGGVGGRAVLSDFGIAKSQGSGEQLTGTGVPVGTPDYMAPEQHAGAEVAPAADVCAAGMVLFETYTGRPWVFDASADRPDWTGVPRRVVRVLARALAWSPADRWADAAQFRRALVRATTRSAALRYGAAGALVLVAALALNIAPTGWWRAAAARASVSIAVRPFGVRGGTADHRAIGDSLAGELRRSLRGMPDFTVHEDTASATVALGGTVHISGDSMTVRVDPTARDAAGQNVFAEWHGPVTSWPLAADSLTRALLVRILTAYTDRDLPDGVLPRTPAGLTAWARAEARFARSEWDAAQQAYRATLAMGECLLCELRLFDIGRWQRTDADTALLRHSRAELRRFPARYQAIIRAGRAAPRQRLDLLDSALRRDPDSWYAAFTCAEEVFHRGPLSGRPFADAVPLLRRTVQLRPAFAPAWEHLARAAITLGNAPEAQLAIARYRETAAPGDLTSQVLLAVNEIGFAWRFVSVEQGRRAMEAVLANPAVSTFPDLPSGPRYFLTLDAPDAALWLSRWFAERSGRSDLLAPGLAGQAAALLALGNRDAALAAARELAAREPGPPPEAALFAAELEAMLLVFDGLYVPARWPRLRDELARLAGLTTAPPVIRRRAAWILTLASRSSGQPQPGRLGALVAEPDAAGHRPFLTLLEADAAARRGEPAQALSTSEPLLALDSAGRAGDPFFRTALHLLRADWAAAAGDPAQASRELLWYQNSDIGGVTPALAQPIEIDLAFGTLARWRRAGLLARIAPASAERCAALGGVTRLWAHADEPLLRRATAAAAQRRAAGCAS
jgi:serine/threonine-protein kinase